MAPQASCPCIYLLLGQISQPPLSLWLPLLPLKSGPEIKFKITLGVSATVGMHPFDYKHIKLCALLWLMLNFLSVWHFLWQHHYFFIRSPCFPQRLLEKNQPDCPPVFLPWLLILLSPKSRHTCEARKYYSPIYEKEKSALVYTRFRQGCLRHWTPATSCLIGFWALIMAAEEELSQHQ